MGKAQSDKTRKAESSMEEETRWLMANRAMLEEKYPGEWVAFGGSGLLAHGQDLHEVRLAARALGFDEPFFSGIRAKDWQDVIVML